MENIILKNCVYYYIADRDKFYNIIEELLEDFKISKGLKSYLKDDDVTVIIENGLFYDRCYYLINYKLKRQSEGDLKDTIYIEVSPYTQSEILELMGDEINRLNRLIHENI